MKQDSSFSNHVAFLVRLPSGDKGSSSDVVEMDTNEDDADVLPSTIEQVSVDEVRAQIYSSKEKTTANHCFDSFNFWRVAPLTVDPALILAVIGDDVIGGGTSSGSISPASVNALGN